MSLNIKIVFSPQNTPQKRLQPDTPPSQRKRKKMNYKEPSEDEKEDEEFESKEVEDKPTQEEIEEAIRESKINIINMSLNMTHELFVN